MAAQSKKNQNFSRKKEELPIPEKEKSEYRIIPLTGELDQAAELFGLLHIFPPGLIFADLLRNSARLCLAITCPPREYD